MKSRSLQAVSLLFALTGGCARTLAQHPASSPSPAQAGASADQNIAHRDNEACFVTGQARTIAPRALIAPGIDVALRSNDLLVGLTVKHDETSEIRFDPATGEATARAQRSSWGNGECEPANLVGAKTVDAEVPFAMGLSNGHIAWASCSQGAPETLWAIADAPVLDLQGVERGDGGYAVLFRQGNAIWMGNLDAGKHPQGALAKIAEGPALRSATLAASEAATLVVWAEHRREDAHWTLGARTFAKDAPEGPMGIEIPGGNADLDALQPSLAALSGGRFLLAWTEGNASAHQVRAAVLDERGVAIGPVLAVSPAMESGWGKPAVLTNGSGAVLFLTPGDEGFAVAATPITCPVNVKEEAGAFALLRDED